MRSNVMHVFRLAGCEHMLCDQKVVMALLEAGVRLDLIEVVGAANMIPPPNVLPLYRSFWPSQRKRSEPISSMEPWLFLDSLRIRSDSSHDLLQHPNLSNELMFKTLPMLGQSPQI